MRTSANITFDIVKSLFSFLEYDRPEISLSGIHVLCLTESFYEHMPLKFRVRVDYEQLRYGALLHDIGKLGIPKEVLNKPGKLEKEEMEMVKSHTDIGARILGDINGLECLSTWIAYHHERIDGKGYYRLKGEEIPLEARIIAITDAYSSITMVSPFKPSRTHEDAVSILRMGAGTQFDQELIEVFCQLPPKILEDATEKAREIIRHAGAYMPE